MYLYDEYDRTLVAEAGFEAREVVDVLPIEVSVENGAIRPVVYRERVRALGPSGRTDLGKQSGNL